MSSASAETARPPPWPTAMIAAPAKPIATPAHAAAPSRSRRNAAAITATNTGPVETRSAAVAHEYDLFPERDTHSLHRTELFTDPLFLVEAEGSGEPVRLADYAARRWILPPPDTACGRLVERACGLAGFEPQPLATSYDFAVACALAAAGHGVALVPQLALDPLPAGIVARPVADVPVRRRVFAAVRAGAERRPAVAALLDALAAPPPSA
jgi:DNA-binding transcriptional LysR family regulator